MKNRWSGKANAAFGGVVIRRTERSDIKSFSDFRNLHVAAVDESSLGGWIAAKAEFLREGIDAETFFRSLAFLGSHEAVVRAVLEGRADAGILRTGVLEQMAEAGTITPTDLVAIKGICCRNDPRPDDGTGPFGIPVWISTPLYPDWPLAKLPHTPDFLAEHVAVALIQMPHDARAAIAAQIGGWSIPANYEPVRAVLKQLGVSPFDDGIAEAAASITKHYWPYLAFALVSMLALFLGSIYVVRLNRVYRRSEARIRALVDASPAGIFFKDADRRYVLANRAYCDFQRIDGDSVLGKRAEEFQPPDRAKRTNEEDLQVYRTQGPVHLDESLPGEDSEPRYFSTRKFPVRDAKGLFIGWGGIAIETTDQKRAELALTEREARYRSVITTTQDGFWMIDASGRLIEVNDAYVRQSGFSREELLSMRIGDLDAQETPEERIRRFNRLIRTGSDLFTTKHRTKSGGTWDVEVRLSHSPIEGGRLFAFHRDIGERKRAEERLRDSEERFRRLYQELPMPYQSLDGDGRIIEVNQAWTTLMGYERDEAIGTAFSDLVAPKDRPDLWRNFARLRATGRVHIPAHTLIGKDGKHHVVAVDATTAESATRRFVQTHCVLTDITDREFLERQLAHAQKMEAVGQLTGGIAHDFNNLLQVVETNLELAQIEAADAPGALRLIERAIKAGRRGADLTQQLLAFSRKQTLNPRTVEPNALIDGMLSLLTRTLGEDITIETRLEDDLPAILVDANGLENAILNLALNARTAMPGGGTLRVTSRCCSPSGETLDGDEPLLPGDHVEIAIADTGCGMSESVLEHAFEPFFTTKDVGQGSGLGLSMVYGFVRQSGGNVRLESTPGKGTTARILLPAGPTVGDAAAADVMGDGRAAPAPPPSITILVVEDDEQVRASTTMLLHSMGCTVREAGDARTGLEILDGDPHIDLLLSDVVLPGGKSGIDLLHICAERHPRLKTILVSGYPLTALQQHDAAVSVLRKPFTREELSAAIAKAAGESAEA